MRGRSTLIVLVAALGLGAYLYFVDAKKPVVDTAAQEKVFSVDSSKITQLEVKSASGEVTALKKDGPDWKIVSPVAVQADQNNASDVAASLAGLERDRVVDENPSDLKTYGLAQPRMEAAFNVDGESGQKKILIGDKSPTGMGIYAKLPNEKRVMLVPNSIDTSLNRSTFDLRDKTAIKIQADKVDSIELASKDQTVRVVKSGSDWKLVKPVEAPADYTSVEGLIGQLQSMQMMALKEKPEDLKDLKQYGLDKPQVVATLGMGSATAKFELGGEAEAGSVWARDPSKTAVFSVNNGVASDLKKKVADLRRKEVFDFRPYNTTRFEITRGSTVRTFERVKGTGENPVDTWKQVVPADKAVDSSNFEGALLDFSNLRADSFVDRAGPATGLDKPAAIVVVKFDDGKKEERVTFGIGGSSVFATRADQPGALQLEAGKYEAAVKKLDGIQ